MPREATHLLRFVGTLQVSQRRALNSKLSCLDLILKYQRRLLNRSDGALVISAGCQSHEEWAYRWPSWRQMG